MIIHRNTVVKKYEFPDEIMTRTMAYFDDFSEGCSILITKKILESTIDIFNLSYFTFNKRKNIMNTLLETTLQ